MVIKDLHSSQASYKKQIGALRKPPTDRQMQSMEALYQAQNQAITRLVFSGGGAKGVVYPGSYRALQQTGVLSSVSDISGASAGAITASLIAIGMPSADFRMKSLTTNFANLIKQPETRE